MFLNRARKGGLQSTRPLLLLAVVTLPFLAAACSLRYDESYRADRAEKQAGREPAHESLTFPSYREMREARAAALAEAEIKNAGGTTYVTPNGGSSSPAQVRFVEIPGALALRVEASERLNQVDGIPNALVLVIYHLTDLTALKQLARTEDGMRKLLDGVAFDETVRSVRQINIQPGMRNRLATNRAEDGRYVAIVAGYNPPAAGTSLYVTSYPVSEYSEAGETAIHRKRKMFEPHPLNLHITLGEDSMAVANADTVYKNLGESTRLLRREPYPVKTPRWLE